MTKDKKRCHEIVNWCYTKERKLAFDLLYSNLGLIYLEEFCCILQYELSNRGHTQIYWPASKCSIKRDVVNLLRESHKERNCVCFHLLFVLFYFGLVPVELEQHTKPQSHVINPYPQVAFNIFLVKRCCFQSPIVFREWSQVQPPHFIHTYILLSQGHE